jgi:hypothetical protein
VVGDVQAKREEITEMPINSIRVFDLANRLGPSCEWHVLGDGHTDIHQTRFDSLVGGAATDLSAKFVQAFPIPTLKGEDMAEIGCLIKCGGCTVP